MRRGVLEGDTRRGAHQVPRIEALLFGAVVVDGHRTLALAHRLLERGREPVARLLTDRQPVHDQVDRMDLVAVEAHARDDLADLAVDAGIEVALAGQRLEELAVMALAALDDRGHQRNAPSGKAPENQLDDPIVGIMHHLLARHGRIGPRSPCVEQTQKVVDLGNGAHRRTRIAVRGLLLDGHDRAQARDLVHVGALHRPDELPRIGRKGLHVAALSLGIDRIEGQRRLARAREARDDHQLVARNLQVHVFQVVDPRTVYPYRILLHGNCTPGYRRCGPNERVKIRLSRRKNKRSLRDSHLEVVGIAPGGELPAEGADGRQIEPGTDQALLSTRLRERPAPEVEQHGVARIMGRGIAADAVCGA